MKRYRLDVTGSSDIYLVAKFIRASSPQAAMQWCKQWLGHEFERCKVVVTLDE